MPSLARFEQEAQLMAELVHPNTVTVHDYGRTADGVLYYAMEYLEGADLQLLVDTDGPQPPARVIHLLRQVCGALTEAHGRGLVHRDIKPANVFLCSDRAGADVVKVLDFGVVKDMTQTEKVHETAEQSIVGTPLYVAPESVSVPRTLDARSDLYSLGALAYFLLTGRPVFNGVTALDVCAKHIYEKPVPPSERLGRPLPADLEALVLRCLEKSPDARPASAQELSRALSACADANDWTEAQAESWWSHGRARIAERRAARAGKPRPAGAAFDETVAVVIRDRTLTATDG